MIKAVKKRIMHWWYLRQMRKNPEEVMRLIRDVINPPEVDWGLSNEEKLILDSYVAYFLNTRTIDYESMDVDKNNHPNLHKLTLALQGSADQKVSWAAYDYLMLEYPDLEKLAEELGEEDDWG